MMTEMRPATAASRSSALDRYWRAANYLGTAQLYLRDNVLLRRPQRLQALRADHLRPHGR